MQTVHEQSRMETPSARFRPSHSQAPASENQVKKLKIREFISWSVCFAIVAGLTGLLKLLKVGVTAESITSTLFYISILALGWFVFRIVTLSRNPVQVKSSTLHELN